MIFLDHLLDIHNGETIEVRFHGNIAQLRQFGQMRLAITRKFVEIFNKAAIADNIQRLMCQLAQDFKKVEHLLKVVFFENEHMLAHADTVYVMVKEEYWHSDFIVSTRIMPDSEHRRAAQQLLLRIGAEEVDRLTLLRLYRHRIEAQSCNEFFVLFKDIYICQRRLGIQLLKHCSIA